MTIDEILKQLADGATLEGPHWTEPVKVLAAKARSNRVEVQAVGLHSKRLWNKMLTAEDFDGAVKITPAGELATLTDNPTHFRLAAEAHRIRLAFQYDPHFAVSVSQVDPLPHQMDAVYSHLLTQPQIRFLIADDPGAGKTIMAGLTLKELKFRGLVERTLIVTPASLTDSGAASCRTNSARPSPSSTAAPWAQPTVATSGKTAPSASPPSTSSPGRMTS